MELEGTCSLTETQTRERAALLAEAGLSSGESVDFTVLIWDDGTLAATGSRRGGVLKCIAVRRSYQGQNITSMLITALRKDAFEHGIDHLFLYTKPENSFLFEPLFFYAVAQTGNVLLMENKKDGIESFLASLPEARKDGTGCSANGCAVMNCNPFTLGHRYLIEKGASECARFYVFVLSEKQPPFPPEDRLALVKEGTADIKNVVVLPTGPYLVSSATFPAYFLKDAESARCELDVQLFLQYFAPRFSITKRFVGSEPLSRVTAEYNQTLKKMLPENGIDVFELPRVTSGGAPISASVVRALLGKGERERLKALVPASTLRYLENNGLV